MLQLDLFEELATVEPAEGSGFTMRPYQRECVDRIFREWESGSVATLAQLPTGCGKTVIFAEVTRRFLELSPLGVMIAAHRCELIDQAADKLGSHLGETPDIEMAEYQVGMRGLGSGSRVVVTSVQTQNAGRRCDRLVGVRCLGCDMCVDGMVRRMQKFSPQDYGLLIIDEGHHATAKTYRRMISYYRRNPELKVLLVTATPKRADRVGLHNVCDTAAYEMGIAEAIDDGWLVPIRQKYVVVKGLDFSRCKTKAGGDLADGDVQRAMMGSMDDADAIMEEGPVHELVSATYQESAGRPTLVFCAGKDHVEAVCGIANRYEDVQARYVIDSTPKDERQETIRWFKRAIHKDVDGYTAILVGCGVFTEGFDADNVRVVAVGRPTKSEALYTQIIGRGTRPLSGTVDGPGRETSRARRDAIARSDKPYVTILDFVGNSGRHRLVSTADILAGDALSVDREAAVKAMEGGEAADIREAVKEAKRKRLDREAAEKARRERARKEWEQRERDRVRQHLRATAEYDAIDVDPFGVDSHPERVGVKRGPGGATEKQVNLLVRLGVSRENAETFSKRQAGAVIDKLLNATGPDYVMRFGKHKGKKMRDIPRDYLQWLSSACQDAKVRSHAREAMSAPNERRHRSPDKPREWVDREFSEIVSG